MRFNLVKAVYWIYWINRDRPAQGRSSDLAFQHKDILLNFIAGSHGVRGTQGCIVAEICDSLRQDFDAFIFHLLDGIEEVFQPDNLLIKEFWNVLFMVIWRRDPLVIEFDLSGVEEIETKGKRVRYIKRIIFFDNARWIGSRRFINKKCSLILDTPCICWSIRWNF